MRMKEYCMIITVDASNMDQEKKEWHLEERGAILQLRRTQAPAPTSMSTTVMEELSSMEESGST
jgi:hypothetical protein